jgi:crossover junction endodeoxyribonuclease RuvC
VIYIGIDCGLDGALAVIDGEQFHVWDTPTGKLTKREYIAHEMSALLQAYRVDAFRQSCAYIEAVSGRPGQGTASARSIGFGQGVWIGILAAHGIPFQIVQPTAWKREFGLLKADKNGSRLRAQQLFPQAADRLQRVKDDGRAEALLIAEFARRRAAK